MSLKALGTKSAFIMKVLIPLGSAIAGQINPEPDSQLYKELEALKQKTDNIFLLNKIDIETSSELNSKIYSDDYFTNVIFPINLMKEYSDMIVDPKEKKSDQFIKGFKSYCQFSNKAPYEILSYLSLKLVKLCNNSITPNDANIYINQRNYLIELIKLINITNPQLEFPDIDNYLNDFIIIYEKIDDKSILHFDNLEILKKYYPNYNLAFEDFFVEVLSKSSTCLEKEDIDQCFLKDLLIKTKFNYIRVEKYLLSLRDQLIDIFFTSAICANMTNDGDKQLMDQYTNKIVKKINLITIHTSIWIRNSLVTFRLATVHQQIIAEQFLKTTKDFDNITSKDLKTVLKASLPILSETGEKK
ncbi:hypothetical protein Mgra_00007998 [Meloidogyne graminicola]|uniref:Uncharacterized protein n=1 Tax=Meloidogyne graminicola TaxID=189291 RepID=A0A8S9ZH05_9BILA|nr:hypothetical protein Mgra_00007998 [Meloidogyne graminicola]